MTHLTLYVYPDGRSIVQTAGDITDAMRENIRDQLSRWERGRALVVDGAVIDVVNVQPSVEDRLVAIEERLGLRPVTAR